MLILRSLVFNIIYFGWTTIFCAGVTWTLLGPRKFMIYLIVQYLKSIAFFERVIVGIKYEVRGREHIPQEGCYILAMKHQSVWETMRLHDLCGDPAVIIKKELLYLPFWGWLAWKARLIAVKRNKGGSTMASMVRGAKRIKAEGRPIVIFPQGTRVGVGAHKPYKIGASILYEELNVPMIPVAINAGLYWPRHGFIKRPGTIIIEVLPAIPPGLPREEAHKLMAEAIESQTIKLEAEGRRSFE